MSKKITQQWEEEEFCRSYAATWEISMDQVHYGWLAPGEKSLRLLKDVRLPNATVLDIGCGMGENLIALSKQGCSCFGVDISRFMIAIAEDNQGRYAASNPIHLEVEDMRRLTAFPGVTFDLVLSVYSLEYLRSVKELRDVIATVANRLKPGGVFLFCFSHPLQHLRHVHLQNRTAPAMTGSESMLIYSVLDVVNCLQDCELTVDRVVEQETLNPSKITYAAGLAFPYHFHNGRNPCVPAFDNLSNAAPHTIIYKARKALGSRDTQTRRLTLDHGVIDLWGETWKIWERHSFQAMGKRFEVAALRKPDGKERYLSCTVLDFAIDREEIGDQSQIYVPIGETVSGGQISVSRRSLLGIVLKRLRQVGLHPTFGRSRFVLRDHPAPVGGLFLRRIDPIFGALDGLFSRRRFGLLVFVNRTEPGGGKVGLESFFPSLGDRVYVLYIARDHSVATELTGGQLPLPGLFDEP
jgi:ubiquinone/menaquinone biosynthesis C-methylase UbiE